MGLFGQCCGRCPFAVNLQGSCPMGPFADVHLHAYSQGYMQPHTPLSPRGVGGYSRKAIKVNRNFIVTGTVFKVVRMFTFVVWITNSTPHLIVEVFQTICPRHS
jgi:hypothetical protein